jgi:hypothetical protein
VDQAFECLEGGFAERNAIMMWFRWPLYTSLRTDPRYGELMKRLGLGSP